MEKKIDGLMNNNYVESHYTHRLYSTFIVTCHHIKKGTVTDTGQKVNRCIY